MRLSPETLTIHAPAKVNLFLHVTGKRGDGYHLLDSLAVLAENVCDTLTFQAADAFSLTMNGPFAEAAGTAVPDDNLVLRAARAMAGVAERPEPYAIRLEKNIPVGAGLGGGSADAAATVRMLETAWGIAPDTDRRLDILTALGADVPVCYTGRACRFRGIGDDITPVTGLPPFYLLLIWPNTHVSTKDIFSSPCLHIGNAAPALPDFNRLSDLTDFLGHHTRNDMTDAARDKAPAITDALMLAAQQEGCLLARMSGSGAAVSGIFETRGMAEMAATAVKENRPKWWAQASAVL